jgi:nucleoside-diphosphate-sugar epimerase
MQEKKDLIIGNTSQIAHYWSKYNLIESFESISSRNVDISYIKSKQWRNIIISFANGNTFSSYDQNESFYKVNVEYTLKLIKEIKNNCEKVIYFSTTQLWDSCSGPINLNTYFDHDFKNFYVYSKEAITNELKDKKVYPNVIIVYPFPFDSPFRKEKQYLMQKIFDSIINKKVIEVGSLNFYRDMIHPKFVVKELKNIKEDKIIGSGRLIYVRDFVRDLYKRMGLFDQFYLSENRREFDRKKNVYYLDSEECLYSYEELISDLLYDLREMKKW